MNYKIFTIILFLFTKNIQALEVSIGARKHQAMPLAVAVFGDDQHKVKDLVAQVIKDLEFSNQFKVKLVNLDKNDLSKYDLQSLSKHASLAILINNIAGTDDRFEWRLYNLLDFKMLAGKKTFYKGHISHAAHMVANKIWEQLMGCSGYFNSMIVACKKNKINHKISQHIYAFHATNGTSQKKIVVDANTINFAPRWHPKKRLLYYSQHTPKNVRLMSINEHGHKNVVTNFDGLNLTPAISPKGQIIVSLSSGGCEKLYRYHFDPVHKLNKFVAITDCRMHAISPSFIDEDHVVFCAIDAVNKLPQVTILNLSKRTATFLTGRAFCVAPAYTAVKNKIAYCKRINGVQQIFCYDLQTKEHAQITSSAGDKDECSWSPCGNYLIYTEDYNKESRIAIWNILDHTSKYLSPKGESWCFPAWSPCYDERLFLGC